MEDPAGSGHLSFMSSLSPSSYCMSLFLHISLCLHLVWRNICPWCVLLLQMLFSIWSECNSCDQAWCLLVRFPYCFSTPFFLPPLLFLSHPLSSPSQLHFLLYRCCSPAVCSVCLLFLPYCYFWALQHKLYNISWWCSLMKKNIQLQFSLGAYRI